MRLIDSPISLDEFRSTCYSTFDRMVKIDIDIERKIIAADAEMHADLEEILLEAGSKQEDVWGANIYPEELDDAYIEYTSLINIRPSVGNNSMEVESVEIRSKIKEIVESLILRSTNAS